MSSKEIGKGLGVGTRLRRINGNPAHIGWLDIEDVFLTTNSEGLVVAREYTVKHGHGLVERGITDDNLRNFRSCNG